MVFLDELTADQWPFKPRHDVCYSVLGRLKSSDFKDVPYSMTYDEMFYYRFNDLFLCLNPSWSYFNTIGRMWVSIHCPSDPQLNNMKVINLWS